MILTKEQETTVQKALDHIRAPSKETLAYVIAGLAGTGKSTIISNLVAECERAGKFPIVLTPTGKAASVLREKGLRAQTIHSFCYHVTGLDDSGSPMFSFSGIPPGRRVLIVDEASMVTENILSDLLSTGTVLVMVGDHGQLPPVGIDPGLLRSPHAVLERIHRQAADNDIIRFAHGLRNGERPYALWTSDMKDVKVFDSLEEAGAWVGGDPMILCGTNVRRAAINESARTGETKERICVMRNAKALGLFNGQVFDVEVISRDSNDNPAKAILPTGMLVSFSPQGWGLQTVAGIDFDPYTVVADYGYALTVHKAQGSEWDEVVVVEDWVPRESAERWRYTAATRAKKRLAWVIA